MANQGWDNSPGTTGFLHEICPRRGTAWSRSPGPGAQSGLFLEVVPSSQHLLLSFPLLFWMGVRCQVSLSLSLPGVTASPCCAVPETHCVSALGLLLWGRHREPKVCRSNRVALGPRLPSPVPVSPPQLWEIRLWGTCHEPRALVGSNAACIPQACLLGVLCVWTGFCRQGVQAARGGCRMVWAGES